MVPARGGHGSHCAQHRTGGRVPMGKGQCRWVPGGQGSEMLVSRSLGDTGLLRPHLDGAGRDCG